MSFQNLLIKELFHDEPIKKYVKKNPVTVRRDLTIDHFMKDYFYNYYHKLYPVVDDNNKLIGCISLNEIKKIDKDKWNAIKIRDVMEQCSSDIIIDANTKVTTIL